MRDFRRQTKAFILVLIFMISPFFAYNTVAAPISGLGLPSDHADLAGGSVIDFESNFDGDVAVTFGYADVAMTGNNVLRITNSFSGSFNVNGNSMALTSNDRTEEITFNFSSLVNAFGFNFGGTEQEWRLIAYSTNNTILGDLIIPVFNNSNSGEWFGISMPGIASARLYNTAFDISNNTGVSDYVVLDNFTYVKSVPEPATLALLTLGLVGIGASARKKMA